MDIVMEANGSADEVPSLECAAAITAPSSDDAIAAASAAEYGNNVEANIDNHGGDDDGPPGLDDAAAPVAGAFADGSAPFMGDDEFRGRPWAPGGAQRFRGRGGGFGPPGVGGPNRGGGIAGRGQPFFRGGGVGGAAAAVTTASGGTGRTNPFGSAPTFEQNWNGPPPSGGNPFAPRGAGGGVVAAASANNTGNGHPPFAGGEAIGQQQQPQQTELWVETKAGDDKSYYYHALTRETTWTRPEGPHVKIMSQSDVEALTAKNQQQQQQQKLNADETKVTGADAATAADNAADTAAKDSATNKKVDETGVTADVTKPAATAPHQTQQQQQPQQHHQQQHHQMPPHFGGPPPHFGGHAQHPYGMPPPGYGGTAPWQMPWQQQQPHHQQPMTHGEAPAQKLIVKPGVIEPAVIARAAEWSEHRAPDGRPYYYHAARGESVWEKPQAIRDLEQARMAAHAGTTPQPTVQLPAGPVMTAMQINATPVLTPQMQHQHQIHQITAAQAAAAAAAAAMFHDPQMAFAAAAAQAQAQAAAIKAAAEESVEAKLEKKRKEEAAARKKREEDEKAKASDTSAAAAGAAAPAAIAKPVDKSRPISSTPIAGTPWCVVWTGDGRVFFYNPSTRTSVWERPEDLVGRADVDKAIATTPEQLLVAGAANSAAPAGAAQRAPTIIESATLGGDSQTTSDPAGGADGAATAGSLAQGGPQRRRLQSESSADDADVSSAKKAKVEGGVVTKPAAEKNKDIGKEAAIEAEVRAARERALVPLEIRVKSFKEMLKEKDVSAFSTWEKELHKIVFDPRYLLLTSRERKQVFEKYVKERAEEERREKRNKMRQKRDDFRALMEASHLHGKSSFSDFAQKNGKDDRFKGIEKMREREGLFNEFIVDVRRREKDEKQQKKEQVRKDFLAMLREHPNIDRHCRWQDVKKRIDSDARYRAVENSMLREDYFIEYGKLLKDERRKAKEKERERKEKKEREKREKEREKQRDKERKADAANKATDGKSEAVTVGEGGSGGDGANGDGDVKPTADVPASSVGGKGKDKEKRRDSRTDPMDTNVVDPVAASDAAKSDVEPDDAKKTANHSASHESGTDASVAAAAANDKRHKVAYSDGDSDSDERDDDYLDTAARADRDEREEAERREQRDRERQQRAEHSIKERERAVQLQLAGHLRDRDKEREHHKRDEAMRHFGALLADLVRNADLTWKEVKKQLRKDHRWELVEQLERDDRERIFNDHIDQLARKKRDKFREMLEELQQPRVCLSTAFRDVKRQIRDDPRYLKYNSSEKCEREFRDYIKDKVVEAKAAFRELLLECKLITHKSLEAVQENGQHLREIEEILKNDKRFLVLEHIVAERSQMLMNYLEDLHKRGPPPPPTASESTRRK